MNKKITFTEALLTAVGMVIGSGIFFRADNILGFTEGNIGVAVVAWFVLGFTLIFAGIGMSVLASRSQREGGIVGYMEDCFGEKAAFLTGWFTTFIYIPLLTGILGIVASGFFLQLIGVENAGPGVTQLVGFIFIVAAYTWNYLSTKFSALFSSAATIIKLLPIVIIGIIGMTKLDIGVISEGIGAFKMGLFTAPLLSMAFAFDGWTSVATLSKDMENPQKDIAKVLALNAIIVTFAYVLYFTGMTMLIPTETIIAEGDGHVFIAAQSVLGDMGGKFVLFCVVMSVLGTLNGNVMAGFRYPHALAQAKDLPNSEFFVEESKYGTTGRAAMITFTCVCAWYVLYTVQAFAAAGGAETYLFSGISFDDIPIMAIAAVIILLMIGAMKYGMKEGYGVVKSIIAPIIGIIGQGYVIYSFFGTNSSWLTYMIVVIVIVAIGYGVRSQVKKA
ncbi:APA family basic amino acid/polyamine antiporter [Bacilli bacterium PM5-9]|nr:APA family basic amino acid/polyamine antiporter [Bacilli bacterium PM5-9]